MLANTENLSTRTIKTNIKNLSSNISWNLYNMDGVVGAKKGWKVESGVLSIFEGSESGCR